MSRKKIHTIIFFAILSFSITFSALGGLTFPIDPNISVIIVPFEPIDINFGFDPNYGIIFDSNVFAIPIDPNFWPILDPNFFHIPIDPNLGIIIGPNVTPIPIIIDPFFPLDPYRQWRVGSYLEAADENEPAGLIVRVNGTAGLDNCVLMPSETMEIDIELSEGHNIQTCSLSFSLSNTEAEIITDDINFPVGLTGMFFTTYEPGGSVCQIGFTNNYVPPAEGPAVLMTGLKIHCLGDTPVELVITVRKDSIIDYKVFEMEADLHTVYINQISQPRTLLGLEITGPNEVQEDSEQQYDAIASYDNGDTRKVTLLSQWISEPNDCAEIVGQGVLKSFLVNYPQETVTLLAEYEEDGIFVCSEKDVTILADCETGELVKRNLAQAERMKLLALEQLEAALDKEEAAMDILNDLRMMRDFRCWNLREIVRSYVNIFQSTMKELLGIRVIYDSIEKLNNAQEILNGERNTGPPRRSQRR